MTEPQNSPAPPQQTNQPDMPTERIDLYLDRARRAVYPASTILIWIIVIAFMWGLYNALTAGDKALLDRLEDQDFARGVITFLIALGTIALALIVAVAGLMRGQDGDDPEQQAKRFNRGKEVLTILVGILGTIIGFYYGSADGRADDPPGPEAPAFVLQEAEIPAEVEAGATFTIRGEVSGGTPPYEYSLDFEPDGVFADVEPQAAPGGVGEVEGLSAPPDAADQEVEVTLLFTDDAGGRQEAKGSIAVKPAPGAS